MREERRTHRFVDGWCFVCLVASFCLIEHPLAAYSGVAMHSEGTQSSKGHRLLRRGVLLFSLDILAFALSVCGALILRFGRDIPWEHALPYLYFWPLLFGWRLLMAHVFELYDFRHKLTVTDHAFAAFGAAFSGIAFGYFFFILLQVYALPLTRVSRAGIVIDLALTTLWYVASRSATLAGLRRRGYRVRLLLVGTLESCQYLGREIRAYAPALVEVVGWCAPEKPDGDDAVLGTLDDVPALIDAHRVEQVIFAGQEAPQSELRDLLAACDSCAVELYLYPGLDLAVLVSARVRSIGGIPLIPLRPVNGPELYRPGKRLLDIGAALFLLAVSLPVWLAAALAIKATSPGPVFFSQMRTGRGGFPFRILKFRTMRVQDRPGLPDVLSDSNDPRITPVGHLLRKWRLDELPQLWNVLLGDMSLVGPRPERCELVEQFSNENPLYERRHLVRPGLTGLAQVHGRYDTGYTHKLRYDLVYINTMSLALDLRVLVATIQTVLTGRGAM